MLLWIGVYFVLAVTLLALLMSPVLRESLGARASQCWAVGQRQLFDWLTLSNQSARVNSAAALDAARVGTAFVARRKWLTAGLITAIAGPPLLAFTLRRWNVLEYQEDTRDANQQIAALLRGEQLVAPAPLPPEVFVTAEVATLRSDIVSASRDWGLLDAEFKQRLLLAYRLMKQRHGYHMVLLEGYRSPDRQIMLADLDYAAVTNARAFQSYHQYGLAADSAFYRDGQLVISERDSWAMRGYQLFGETSLQVGLLWGGGWRLRDYGHVELRRPGVLRRQQAQ